jgi:hypothetical protein
MLLVKPVQDVVFMAAVFPGFITIGLEYLMAVRAFN